MLNLRRTYWKNSLFSANFRWGSDVALYTNILALWNPATNTKNLNLIQIDFGFTVSTNNNILSQVYLFTSISSATDLTANIIKFNPNDLSSIANIYAGGSLTLDKIVTRRSFGFNSNLRDTIDFPQELELPPGWGVCLIHEAETAALTYTPYGTFYWFE